MIFDKYFINSICKNVKFGDEMYRQFLFSISSKAILACLAFAFCVLGHFPINAQEIKTGKFEHIFNGGFELGNTGFYSDYDFMPDTIIHFGVYTIARNSKHVHPLLADCGDRKMSDGLMMIVNGHTFKNQIVWQQTANVKPYTDYYFSFWFTGVVDTNSAVLKLTINNYELESTPIALSTEICNWRNYSLVWNSGASSIANITIIDLIIEGKGNDFSLDDISLRQVCKLQASVCDEKLICKGNSTQISAYTSAGFPPFSYKWFPAEGLSADDVASPAVTIDRTTTYYVIVSDSLGCEHFDSVKVVVKEIADFEIAADKPTEICPCEEITLSAPMNDDYVYQWSNGSTESNITVEHSGIYTVTVSNDAGCVVQKDILVEVINTLTRVEPISVNASPGDTIEIPLVITEENDLQRCGFNEFSTVVKTKKSLLLPIGDVVEIKHDGDYQLVYIRGSKNGNELAKIKFIAALGEEICTDIEIIEFEWECAKSPVVTTNARFCISDVCIKPVPRLFKDTGALYLSQNKPNPAESLTTIDFSVIENGFTRLVITDIIGTRIYTLFESETKAGSYSVSFDASKLWSGAYFYILYTPSGHIVKRMEVIR